MWVSAEALDVIIDLYSDDKTDKLAHQTHLVERLKGIQPQFKAKVRMGHSVVLFCGIRSRLSKSCNQPFDSTVNVF